MHQEIKSPVSDVEAFLTQTIAPFYDTPPDITKEGKSSRGGPSRGGRGRGRGAAATSNSEPQPNLRLRYIGLNTAFVRIDLPPIRDTLLRLQTFALSRLLAFHIVPIDTECHPFVVCLIYSTALDKDDITSRRMLYSIKQKLRDNNTVFSNLLAPLSKTAGSMQHKVHSFVSSMDIISTGYTAPRKGRNTSVWVLYAAPFAKGDSYRGVDDSEKTVRRYIASLTYKFIDIEENISINCWGEQTECSLCKLMEHHFSHAHSKRNPGLAPRNHIDACIREHREEAKKIKILSKI
ncbi:hypothetical protein C8R41DRAFT_100681 [Lentinula lateritia]|uniref:Uncharacterized protein n=1 Tax=Lentinula lateritia TaxID=40482 RepID=A0ABQ8UXX7_9AGAR|nr:hypothetical protein C8R41DRAFT_100681 [Lentinula lateritia]